MTKTNRDRSVSPDAQANRGKLSATWRLLRKARAQEATGRHAAANRTLARFYHLSNTPPPRPKMKSALGHSMGGVE